VVGRQNADTADILHTGDVAMASIFWLSVHIQRILASPGEYKSTVHVWRRCGLMSNYFYHLLYFLGKKSPLDCRINIHSMSSVKDLSRYLTYQGITSEQWAS